MQFFQQIVLTTIADDFSEVIQSQDDLCGISIAKRWKAHIIMIWTRRGDESRTINSIRDIVFTQAQENVKITLQNPRNCYYRKHRDHPGFDELLAKTSFEEYTARKALNEIVSPEDQRPSGGDALSF